MYLPIDVILDRIPADARVLDLGGWDKVFPRANVVVDLNPYATRRRIYPDMEERFTEKDWIIADFCSAAFWDSIPDKAFDFITIGHTLEDIRDPLYVCKQMIRCGNAGYIESPSKFRECAKASAGDGFSGFDHHRWIIEPNEDLTGIIFKAKLAWAHHRDYLGDANRHLLSDYHMQFDGLFWKGSFSYIEHVAKGMHLETSDLVQFYETSLAAPRPRRFLIDLKPDSSHPKDGQCLWVSDYLLQVER